MLYCETKKHLAWDGSFRDKKVQRVLSIQASTHKDILYYWF